MNKIRKRDGRIVEFDRSKITGAIYKSFAAVGEPDLELAEKLSRKVADAAVLKFPAPRVVTVEEIQDIVEQVLTVENRPKAAKAYILYRQKRTQVRKEKEKILGRKEIDEVDKKFDVNALRVLHSRYLKKGADGKVIESPKELFRRVATHLVIPSLFYDRRMFAGKTPALPLPALFDPKKHAGKISIGKYPLNEFHLKALKRVYLRFHRNRQVKMTLAELLKELQKGRFDAYEKEIDRYYNLMVEKRFLPNTPTLVNFGSYLGMGSACFVLGIDDSIESVMETLKRSALIFKAGGGVGYNFSKLRPEGDFVQTTGGVSSGPISFMELFDKMTDVIKQGGVRRGASIGILDINHPDIEKFIRAKEGNKKLRNFNISVRVLPDFWKYYEENKPYPLVNPRSKTVDRYVDPMQLFDLLVYQGWESAEPGIIFDDNINKYNPFTKSLGPIKSTNPCGEVLLYPNESCNLGSINVWAFAKESVGKQKKKVVDFDWEGLAETVRTAAKFLDNVVEVNEYPLREIEELTLATRKIGLGVMGLADLLYELEIPYNSEQGFCFMEDLMEFINYHSKVASSQLAVERGPFPYFEKSFYPEGRLPFSGPESKPQTPVPKSRVSKSDWQALTAKIKKQGLRNAYTVVIAPAGSLSMIAGTSSGIEPVFSLIFEKKVTVGSFYYIDPVFEKTMSRAGLFDEELIKEVARTGRGSIQNLSYIPERLKKALVTAMDISPEDHIRALAVLQRWVDSSISKTTNLPFEATLNDLKKVYLLAHRTGCKDVSVFRDRSISGVLSAGKLPLPEGREKEEKEGPLLVLQDIKAQGRSIYRDPAATAITDETGFCPACSGVLIETEGCKRCPNCGWGLCD